MRSRASNPNSAAEALAPQSFFVSQHAGDGVRASTWPSFPSFTVAAESDGKTRSPLLRLDGEASIRRPLVSLRCSHPRGHRAWADSVKPWPESFMTARLQLSSRARERQPRPAKISALSCRASGRESILILTRSIGFRASAYSQRPEA